MQVRASHILVETEEQVKDLMIKMTEGANFADLARQHSRCPSGQQGGDLGMFGRGQMVPEFEQAAFDNPVGALVGPVRTQFGYHLVQRTA
jgi:peptidyl-prolyl cis-trans isomerase C